MSISDKDFREAFKPLHIPAHYNTDDSDENKIVYALAQLGKGTTDEVADELYRIDAKNTTAKFGAFANAVLNNLYQKGLIKGTEVNGSMQYNLSKITEANDGAVNPGLLAPGLD